MAFTWVQPLGSNSKALLAVINEIHNNVDNVDDSKCITHNGVVNSSENINFDSSEKSIVKIGVDTSVFSNHYNSADDGHKSTVKASEYAGYCSSNDSSADSSDDSSAKALNYEEHYFGERVSYCAYVHSSNDVGVNTSARYNAQ